MNRDQRRALEKTAKARAATMPINWKQQTRDMTKLAMLEAGNRIFQDMSAVLKKHFGFTDDMVNQLIHYMKELEDKRR